MTRSRQQDSVVGRCQRRRAAVAAPFVVGALACTGTPALAAYSGGSPAAFLAGTSLSFDVTGRLTRAVPTILPAVKTCPLPGFKGANAPAPKVLKFCTVPKLKGKKFAAARTALTKAHCAVGTVRKIRSKTVAKGSVISQRIPAGTQQATSRKVNLVVSSGP